MPAPSLANFCSPNETGSKALIDAFFILLNPRSVDHLVDQTFMAPLLPITAIFLLFRPVNQNRHACVVNARRGDTAENDPFESTARVRCHGQDRVLHAIHVTAYRVPSFAVEHVPARLDFILFLDFGGFALQVGGFEERHLTAGRPFPSVKLGPA